MFHNCPAHSEIPEKGFCLGYFEIQTVVFGVWKSYCVSNVKVSGFSDPKKFHDCFGDLGDAKRPIVLTILKLRHVSFCVPGHLKNH